MKQPLAYVHPDAKVSDNVVIEPFVSIDHDVEIGEGTRIGSSVNYTTRYKNWKKL